MGVASLLFAVMLLGLMCGGIAGSADGRTTSVPYFVESGKFFVRPTFTIDVSGTGSWLISRSHWRTWQSNEATAVTTLDTNTCSPSCATGHYTQRTARVRFYDVVACSGRRVFDRFSVSTPAGRPLLAGDFRSLGYLARC